MVTTQVQRPLPEPDRLTQFFWDATKRHELAILQCGECGTYIHPPRPVCYNCLSDNVAGAKVSGHGTIYTYVVAYQVSHPYFDKDVPYPVVVVELPEQPGLRIEGRLLDCPEDQVRIGAEVEAVFEDVTDEFTSLAFRPRGGQGGAA